MFFSSQLLPQRLLFSLLKVYLANAIREYYPRQNCAVTAVEILNSRYLTNATLRCEKRTKTKVV